MKVRTFRLPSAVVANFAQGRSVLRGASYLLRRSWPAALLLALVASALALSLFPHDAALLAQIHNWTFAQEHFARDAACFLGTWGDYLTYNLPFSLGLWLYGWTTKSSFWRRAAVICFLGGTLAGLLDDCFRLTLGRPRPDAHQLDGFYGFPSALNGRYQSFPSGHAAATFGTAFSLLVINRLWGSITLSYALLVVWARMEIYRHYPSDIVVGSLLGIYVGLLVGLGAKVRLSRPAPPPGSPKKLRSPRLETVGQ